MNYLLKQQAGKGLVLTMRIFLTGFMGSGKSTVAKELSRELKLPCIDLDEEIEKKWGQSISLIFKLEGESAFREKEAEALRELIQKHTQAVFSVGGGTPCFLGNQRLMDLNGISIYLQLSPEQLFERLKEERSNRPILADEKHEDLLKSISDRLAKRKPYYEAACFTVDGNRDISDIVKTITELVKTAKP